MGLKSLDFIRSFRSNDGKALKINPLFTLLLSLSPKVESGTSTTFINPKSVFFQAKFNDGRHRITAAELRAEVLCARDWVSFLIQQHSARPNILKLAGPIHAHSATELRDAAHGASKRINDSQPRDQCFG